jgi:hypothetical protein
MTGYQYAIIRRARQVMTDQELAVARQLAEAADSGDKMAWYRLLEGCHRICRERRRRTKREVDKGSNGAAMARR